MKANAKDKKAVVPETSKMSEGELNQSVTRREFIDVLEQISNNINQANQYVMDDMNALYGQHLFPNEIKMAVLEDMLIEKMGVTAIEIQERYNKRLEELQEQAKKIKQNQDGSEEIETEEGTVEETSEEKTEEGQTVTFREDTKGNTVQFPS